MARDDELLRKGRSTVYESQFRRDDDEMRVLCTRRICVDGVDGQKLIVGISEDVTDRRSAEAKIRFLADHDELTGLANRATCSRHLTELLTAPEPAAVLYLDLDRFKAVNDLYGHGTGDLLLIQVAERIANLVASQGLVARLGGDEFAVLLPGLTSGEAEVMARRLIGAVDAAFELEGRIAHVGLSVGIAMAPTDGTTAADLLRNADMALYRAKDMGRRTSCFFDAEMDRAARLRRELEQELRAGMERGEVVLHYQPLACLEEGRIFGFEALARWNHPTRGQLGPEIFIPIAEEGGLIVELGRVVLDLALSETARWEPPLKVAVNLSPVQFLHGDFAADVADALTRWKVPAERLELEITEGVLIRDADAALILLQRLKALGVGIAMDDFGTGYSSLSYFRMFPFDKVKIDRSFIREMESNQQARAVVHAVIGLAKGLGMPVVAEGVETTGQMDMLVEEGCTQAQGFLIGSPDRIERFASLIDRGETRRTAAA